MTKDQDQRIVASHILKTANTVVTTERGNQHGGAEDSFQMIADLWTTYIRNQQGIKIDNLKGYDVAQMMTLLKVARAVHGNPLNEDNYVDAAGYQSLAASIAGVKVPGVLTEAELDAAATKAIAEKFAKAPPERRDVPTTKTLELGNGGSVTLG